MTDEAVEILPLCNIYDYTKIHLWFDL